MNKKILLVDDEVPILNTLQKVLAKENYQIYTATNAMDGLTTLANEDIQVIVSDQRMPKMTGSEFFTRVKSKYPNTVRILLTGYPDLDAVGVAINEGSIFKFVLKPWKNEELIESIREAFEAYIDKNNSDAVIKQKTALAVKRLQHELLSNLSHEIRTPLNGLIGFSEMVNNGLFDINSDEHKECLREILSSSQLLSKMIGNILDFAQEEIESTEFYPEKVELSKILNDITKEYAPLTNKEIQLDIKIDPSVDMVYTDKLKIQKICRHFISNAIKFSNGKCKIEISIKPENEKLFRIEVKDNGIGIPDHSLHDLFIPFKQLNSGMDKKYEGAGIGLALIKRIVENQGGQVGVTSQVGKGSTFFVILPRKLNGGDITDK